MKSLQKIPVLFFAVPLLGLYFFLCVLSYRNSVQIKALEKSSLSVSFVKQKIQRSYLNDAVFFRGLAERLQFFPHKPADLIGCYRIALKKSPADYRTFHLYANYLANRNCCEKELIAVLDQLILRSGNKPESHLMVGSVLLAHNQRAKALPFLRRALELGASLSPRIFSKVETGGRNYEDLLVITPDQPEPLLSLARHLSSKGKNAEKSLHATFQRLAKLDLQSDQRLDFARLALNAGELSMADAQARLAMLAPKSQMPALQVLMDLAWQKRDWKEYQNINSRIEAIYRKSGNWEEAAQYALDKWGRLSSGWEKQYVEEELLRILKDYPDYAPAYVEAAAFYEEESPNAALQFLKRSVSVAPKDFRYNNRLAEYYLKLSMTSEAEAIYRSFLNDSDSSSDAYVGLAHCKESMDQNNDAIAILEEGISRNARSEAIWWELGRIQAEVGNLRGAAQSYLQYAELRPDRLDGVIRAAEAYELIGDHESAREQYRRILSIDPQNAQAKQALEKR